MSIIGYIKALNGYWESSCTNPPKFEKSNCTTSLFAQKDSPKIKRSK